MTLNQMMDKLEDDRALAAAARVNTRENVRLTFDQKVDDVIQGIVETNFDLYKRITDDRAFGELVKTLLFDQYLRGHRNAEELIKRGESKTLEFKSTLRWNLKEDRKDNRVTHAALKTIAAFLNTEGGDLLLGVADDGSVVGIERDGFDTNDKFMLHFAQVCPERARRSRRDVHRPKNPDLGRRRRVCRQLPAKPRARLPPLEGSREHRRRRFLRSKWPRHRQADAGKRPNIHSNAVFRMNPEGWSVGLRRSGDEMQADLDAYLETYNWNRAHRAPAWRGERRTRSSSRGSGGPGAGRSQPGRR